MVKILGIPFADYVHDQIQVRQAKLANPQKNPEDLTVFNANTAWVRLSSGVRLEPSRAQELSTKLGIAQSLVEGPALARNLVLWGGVSSFTPTQGKAILDSGKGGVGYGVDNSYGFLSNSEQGLKPMPGIERISCNYKNNGSLKQASVDIKCYTRSQFEALEATYLRLGYTMVLEWGNALWFDNQGNHQQTKAYSIPNLLFRDDKNLDSVKIQDQILRNKKQTAANYDAMVAKVSNYSWTLNEDLSFSIKVDLISVGDVVDSLKMNLGGSNSVDLMKHIEVSASFQNLVAIQINKEASQLNNFFYELYDTTFKNLIAKYGSEENRKQIQEIDDVVETADEAANLYTRYKPVLDSYKQYYRLLLEAKAIAGRAEKRSDGVIVSIKTEDLERWNFIIADLDTDEKTLKFAFDPPRSVGKFSGNIETIDNFGKALDAIDTYLSTVTVKQGETATVKNLNNQNPDLAIQAALETGYFDRDETVEVPGGQLKDPNYVSDSFITDILENLLGIGIE